MNQVDDYKQNQLAGTHALVNEHISLVNRIAGYLKARVPQFMEYEDMVQIGMLGLLELNLKTTRKIGSRERYLTKLES